MTGIRHRQPVMPQHSILPRLHLTALCRWANVAMGALHTLVNMGNVVGQSWAFYLVHRGLEAVLTVTIAVLAFRWPRSAPKTVREHRLQSFVFPRYSKFM